MERRPFMPSPLPWPYPRSKARYGRATSPPALWSPLPVRIPPSLIEGSISGRACMGGRDYMWPPGRSRTSEWSHSRHRPYCSGPAPFLRRACRMRAFPPVPGLGSGRWLTALLLPRSEWPGLINWSFRSFTCTNTLIHYISISMFWCIYTIMLLNY